jgi:Protein of unknown function (DUF1552)
MWFSLKENHMQPIEAATLDRKSGGARLSRLPRQPRLAVGLAVGRAVKGSAVPPSFRGNVFRPSAEGQGADTKLSKNLSPLEPLKQKINVMGGLYVHALTGQGIHPGQTGSLLSGAHIAKSAITGCRETRSCIRARL